MADNQIHDDGECECVQTQSRASVEVHRVELPGVQGTYAGTGGTKSKYYIEQENLRDGSVRYAHARRHRRALMGHTVVVYRKISAVAILHLCH